MKLKTIGKAAKATLDGIIFGLKKRSPQIAITLGIVGVGVGLVSACVSTLKVPEIMESSKKELDRINTEKMEDNEAQKQKFIVGLKTFGKLAKTYAVPVIITVTSVGAIILSHRIMASRIAMLSSSYATVSTAFRKYRNNVIERFGPEVDSQLKLDYDITTVEKTGEDGHPIKEKTFVPNYKKKLNDPFVFCIDKTCGPWGPWYTDVNSTLAALKRGETLANAKLTERAAGYSSKGNKKRGFLTVNEALECAGLHQYKSKQGDEYGWFYYPDAFHPYGGDNFVSFGLDPVDSPDPIGLDNYKHGLTDAFYIRFNVDGPIKALLNDDDYKR